MFAFLMRNYEKIDQATNHLLIDQSFRLKPSRKNIGVYTPTASPQALCIMKWHAILSFFD